MKVKWTQMFAFVVPLPWQHSSFPYVCFHRHVLLDGEVPSQISTTYCPRGAAGSSERMMRSLSWDRAKRQTIQLSGGISWSLKVFSIFAPTSCSDTAWRLLIDRPQPRRSMAVKGSIVMGGTMGYYFFLVGASLGLQRVSMYVWMNVFWFCRDP